jgi:hypothetical protein
LPTTYWIISLENVTEAGTRFSSNTQLHSFL